MRFALSDWRPPEIEVSLDDARLFDGTSTIDFGVTPPDVTVTQSVTIENVGTQTLTFDQPISLPDGRAGRTGSRSPHCSRARAPH